MNLFRTSIKRSVVLLGDLGTCTMLQVFDGVAGFESEIEPEEDSE